MTNKEIDKLLELIDKKGLEYIKNYLLIEKIANNDRVRQESFEKYMTNCADNCVSIYQDENQMIFTNGISLYSVNPAFFRLDAPCFKLDKNASKFKFVDKSMSNKLLNKVEEFSNFNFIECSLYCNSKSTEVGYIHEDEVFVENFQTSEIETADKILYKPTRNDNYKHSKYKISPEHSILKLETEIGKAYVLKLEK